MAFLETKLIEIDMEYYFGILQNIGFHTLLGLSAYLLLLTGQLSMAQVGFFAIGAYASGILTVIYGVNIFLALGVGAIIASFFAFLNSHIMVL